MADDCSPPPLYREIPLTLSEKSHGHGVGNGEIPKSEQTGGLLSDDDNSRHSNSIETTVRNSTSQRYFIAVEYIGTRFSGAQKQLNGRTVAGVVEDAFHKFIGQPVSVFCSSRTDAGVHALSNVFHVDVERISKRKPGETLDPHEPSVIIKAANHFLQKEGDLRIIDVHRVPHDFHARFEAQERTYYYRLLCGQEPLSMFDKDRAWHVRKELDVVSMQKACDVLTGCHDFSSFRGSGCQAKSPIRTVEELHIAEVNPWLSCFPSMEERRNNTVATAEPSVRGFGGRGKHRCYIVTARARSFLYHQVRMMVGVLKCVGAGELTAGEVEEILERKTAGVASRAMAPPFGLYLGNVKYDFSSAPGI